MHELICVGMNHKTAPLGIRELAAGVCNAWLLNSTEILQGAGLKCMVVLSTCNRTEIYTEARGAQNLLLWLSRRLELDIDLLKKYTYVYSEQAAVRHLMQVASWVDSMVVGEVEILGQLKLAYQRAVQQECVSKTLRRLFESAFAVAKKVRTQTQIGVNPVSVAYLAVRLAERIFTRLSSQTVLLVGAGDTAQLMLKHLNGAGVRNFIIANRTVAHAQALAANFTELAIEIIELSLVPQYLARADIVVVTTAAPLPIIGKGMVERAIKLRKYRAIFMIDLSVPRNIEPQTQQIPDVYLYGIDDLQKLATEHIATRKVAAEHAVSMIEHEAAKFMQWVEMQQVVATLQDFRKTCEQQRDQLLIEALRQIDQGREPKLVLQRFAHVLLNKMIHQPTMQIRQASLKGDVELLEVVKKIYNVQSEEVEESISESVN